MLTPVTHAGARADLADAVTFYEEKRAGLGLEFTTNSCASSLHLPAPCPLQRRPRRQP